MKSKPYNWIFLLKSLISDGILVTHMPDGPTAHFKLTSVKLGKEIRVNDFFLPSVIDSLYLAF